MVLPFINIHRIPQVVCFQHSLGNLANVNEFNNTKQACINENESYTSQAILVHPSFYTYEKVTRP